MENSKQVQKAGANSQQIQAGAIIVNNGISEERVRAVFGEMFALSCKEYTKDAYEIAGSRVQALEDSLLPRIAKIEGAATSFADPNFQYLLRDAQKAAASSERENDYDLLSELLVCHIEKGENRKTRASVRLAINIVDDIDSDALCALTVAHAIARFTPRVGMCREGLSDLNDFYTKLIYEELPTDPFWMDHLDVLDTIRIMPFPPSPGKKIIDACFKRLDGYICVGIKKDSQEHKRAVELLLQTNINRDILVENELVEGYVRLAFPNRNSIGMASITHGAVVRAMNETETAALKSIWDLYSTDKDLQQEVTNKFMEIWDSFAALKKLRDFCDTISSAFAITQTGTVLAHTNAKRCDPTLPDLI